MVNVAMSGPWLLWCLKMLESELPSGPVSQLAQGNSAELVFYIIALYCRTQLAVWAASAHCPIMLSFP